MTIKRKRLGFPKISGLGNSCPVHFNNTSRISNKLLIQLYLTIGDKTNITVNKGKNIISNAKDKSAVNIIDIG